MKKVYCMRVKLSESDEWSDVEYFRTRKERDTSGSMNRILGGVRTYSFEEMKSKEEIESIFELTWNTR